MMALANMAGAAGQDDTDTDHPPAVLHDFFAAITCAPALPPAVLPEDAATGDKNHAEALADPSASASAAAIRASSSVHGLLSCSSGLGSERQGGNNSEVFHFHARKNIMSGPELSLSGRKRSYSDSTYTGLLKNRVLPLVSDSFQTSNLFKMYGKELVNEQLERSPVDDFIFSMQTPPRPASVTLNPSLSSRPGTVVPRWDVNHGRIVQGTSNPTHMGAKLGMISPTYAHKDSSVAVTIISQHAADEGSRTGIIGSGLNTINPSNKANERNSLALLPRALSSSNVEPETLNTSRCHATATASHQMTIFYAGQAHVFDYVHPNKADVIMALAGSSGGSWSTTYAPKATYCPSASKVTVPAQEEILGGNQVGLVIKDGRQMTQAAAPNKQKAK